MPDLNCYNPYRLPRLLSLTIITIGGLAILWVFKLEALTFQWLGLPYDSSVSNAERWRFVVIVIGLSMLSLILPTAILKHLIRKTRASYLRLQRTQSHTETLAKYDSLSGLINRRIFMDIISDQLGHNRPVVVMLIDLDNFKIINDQHGHSAGDVVLIRVSRRLEEIAEVHGGIAVRLGGDEFCLTFLSHKSENTLSYIAESTIVSLNEPMLDDLSSTQLSVTIGISRSWIDAQEAFALLHCADTAMYRGGNYGRSVYNFYDSEYEKQRCAQTDLDFCLQQAIEREEVVPFFQPIVMLPSQDIVGFEILARWVKSDGSIGMPTDFIPVLERLGLIPAMTRSLVKQACRAAQVWDKQLHLSLNVSAAMIVDELFPEQLLDQLMKEKFPFNRFEVEITEEALVGNLEAAQKNIKKLHAHGITVSLDDFGTGYSGLYHLTRLSIDKIKIDRSFFETGETDHLPMVEAILGMARSLKMKVTAEGIEEVHFPHLPLWLADNGCHYAQGFFYGRPQACIETAAKSLNSLEYVLKEHFRPGG
ncbi:putative bifunctional diguanylate cyclase/phosphodiesterase [Pseudomonas syringae]|nr:bifunctional diguanylate cyclase/phosphodiesterase [Pseudomonas syringae]KOG03590.1 GGDEF domain-containing protein [Pseudomonas syringae pv. aceris]